jgi:hypothetical protein
MRRTGHNQENAMMATKVKTSASPMECLLVGRSRGGDWIVRDRSGRRGGLFVSLADAQRYARLESIGRAAAVVMVQGHLELDLSSARKK